MAGLTSALSTAVSGLFAQQQAIAATSENIANVNTKHFARRETHFLTDAIPNQFSGVSVEIMRAGVNRYLQGAGFDSASDQGAATVIADALARIESTLGAPGDNQSFANKLDEAFAAFALLSAAPNSVAAKAQAIGALDSAFAAFSRTLQAIDGEAAAADARLDTQIARANTLLEDIFNLNQIAPESNSAGDELDARLRELSGLMDIKVSRADDGRVTVSLSDGRLLANAGGYAALGVAGGARATLTLSNVAPESGARTLISGDINAAVRSGEIGGLTALRNDELPALRQTVEASARNVANALNAVYAGNASVGQTGPGTTPLIVETGEGFAVNAAIADNPLQLAVARPSGGPGGANDGTGAAALAAIAESGAVRDVAAAVTALGAAAQVAADRATTAQTFAASIETRLLNESGVNLDQELSNLIQFQRAYTANARVIAAVDELYQSLLSIL